MESRRCIGEEAASAHIKPIEGTDRQAMVCCPVISGGDVTGSVLLLSQTPDSNPNDLQCKLTQAAAAFLSRQLED